VVNEFILEIREEALGHCIVVGAFPSTHAGEQSGLFQSIAIGAGAVGGAAIGVISKRGQARIIVSQSPVWLDQP